jgi:ribosome-binding protein aMBF1 (putative translation factor)
MSSECQLCGRKENSILAVTGMQIAVGERCYTRLLNERASWEPETELKKLEEMLEGGR